MKACFYFWYKASIVVNWELFIFIASWAKTGKFVNTYLARIQALKVLSLCIRSVVIVVARDMYKCSRPRVRKRKSHGRRDRRSRRLFSTYPVSRSRATTDCKYRDLHIEKSGHWNKRVVSYGTIGLDHIWKISDDRGSHLNDAILR